MAKVLGDVELRARWYACGKKTIHLAPDTIITPAGQDFLKENGIAIDRSSREDVRRPGGVMTVTSVPMENGRVVYADESGKTLHEKGEALTILRGNVLVPKTHPEIIFRGKLDTLSAQIMKVQLVAQKEFNPRIDQDVAELASYVQLILGAEVKDQPLPEIRLLGLDSAGLRRVSQNPKKEIGIDHPIPNYGMGELCVELNLLRAQVREVELAAMNAYYKDGVCSRTDIIEALNRLSSAVYIIFCRKLASYYI